MGYLPWVTESKVARLICDIYLPDGRPFPGDPRAILKNALKQAEELGYTAMNVGPEPEFSCSKPMKKAIQRQN